MPPAGCIIVITNVVGVAGWCGGEGGGHCHHWHWQIQHGTKDCNELVAVGIKIEGLEWGIIEGAGADGGCQSTRWGAGIVITMANWLGSWLQLSGGQKGKLAMGLAMA